MSEHVLITGGAGFIGSHLTDALIAAGHQVTILDSLHPQIHGEAQIAPSYLHPKARLIRGDVRDPEMVSQAIEDVTTVFHFAAHTGVGQSMYQIREYVDVNVQGTAVLLEQLLQQKKRLNKLVLASSRAVYGEGAYECARCGFVNPPSRTAEQLKNEQWELICPTCGQAVKPIATPENYPTDPRSVYAITKLNQEQICRLMGEAYEIPIVTLRYFNVYGPRQSLQNPYTGVISTFIMRLVNNNPLLVYEDGQESRDFVFVSDVVQACVLAMVQPQANGKIFNVGTGESLTLLQIAQTVSKVLDGPEPIISGQYRIGDIRHCFADISKIQRILGYTPKVDFEEGIRQVIAHMPTETLTDLSHIAEKELLAYGLAAKKS